MTAFTYDKSFEGLLCCVFYAFEQQVTPDILLHSDDVKPLFLEKSFPIVTESEK